MEEFAKSILWMGLGAGLTWFFIKKLGRMGTIAPDHETIFNPSTGYGTAPYGEVDLSEESFSMHHHHKGGSDHFYPRMG